MKKANIKKRTKKFEEGEAVVKKQDLEDAIRKIESEIIAENKEYGITLIALVITVIVLLILARHFGEYALTAIIRFYRGQQRLGRKQKKLKMKKQLV